MCSYPDLSQIGASPDLVKHVNNWQEEGAADQETYAVKGKRSYPAAVFLCQKCGPPYEGRQKY